MNRDRWFVNRTFDLGFFHLPVWMCWLAAFLLPEPWRQATLPTWVWVGAVLLVDVGHVWSSLYRTYLDPVSRRTHRVFLRVVPLACFLVCVGLALHSNQLFWRVLAYVAVFHFIKQQVGITALYRYRQGSGQAGGFGKSFLNHMAKVDKAAVYVGTLFPVIYWHATPGKQISWFIPGDFLPLSKGLEWLAGVPGGAFWLAGIQLVFVAVWVGTIAYWLLFHLYWVHRAGMPFPLGKSLWVLGTCFNWYLGIVYFDSDVVFTLTNVIAHGVPYYGLIALYGHRKLKAQAYGRRDWRLPGRKMVPVFYALLLVPILFLAFTEEYFWDFLLYREHETFFESLWSYPREALSHPWWRAFWMGLLAVPQVTHYVLDGFIWKFNQTNPDLKRFLLG